jgi:hypothetical protein
VSQSSVRLSKPLYKEEPVGGTQNDTPLTPVPRPAMASVWARMAAVAVDVLFLHVLVLVIVTFFSDQVAALGRMGPYMGLSLGLIYLTVCNCSGRSLGRVLLRHEVMHRSGAPLALSHAFARALFLVGPLFALETAGFIAESINRPDSMPITIPLIQYGALGATVAWYATNFALAAFDRAGRTAYDWILGSQVLTNDSLPEDQAFLLAQSRELKSRLDLPGYASMLAGLAATLPLVLVGSFVFMSWNYLKTNPHILHRSIEERKALDIPGFLQPIGRQMVATTEEERQTTDVMGLQFDYLRQGTLTKAEVMANPRATTAIDRATSVVTSMWQTMLELPEISANPQQLARAQSTRQLIAKVNFVQSSDLFFASRHTTVHSTSRSLELVQGRLTTATLEAIAARLR